VARGMGSNEFRPGLEGVVAVETEIAEPDREGGSLRYRGVDIEELVGHVPYEKVWGLLVDESFEPGMPGPEGYQPKFLSGNAPADLQSEAARLSSEWKLGKLNEIDDEQAREDLGRLSAEMMAIVARAARVRRPSSLPPCTIPNSAWFAPAPRVCAALARAAHREVSASERSVFAQSAGYGDRARANPTSTATEAPTAATDASSLRRSSRRSRAWTSRETRSNVPAGSGAGSHSEMSDWRRSASRRARAHPSQ